ncbi:long-chain fatty acid--CoA ligase [Microvirga sp. STR05]|uniref:Long-chain fatty acid--CoA ligase n=1 Tax=Hymenobacter duratus TaxID=2771356 RepID=A0ABR8JPY6_9BACT|nr:long-chain fatty acid--CoA ligase [Hymenobacter duratus]MBD2716604.1 long-chain fatty acid--CoA ligase [Hymenobacter duratus]MBR7951519.1 long-chain fatty acid--CoA ligase [Microvirga sp. STR05]
MQIRRTFDLLAKLATTTPQADCLVEKKAGRWEPLSTARVQELSNRVSLALAQLGIGHGDKVAIISANRPEWVIADFGIAQLGAVSVPMYPTITVEDYRHIFQDAGVRVVLVEDKKLLARVQEAVAGLAHGPEYVFTFDEVPGSRCFTELLAAGQAADPAALEPLKAAVQPDDLLTLIYTSGTTGRPKGVMLSHRNILYNCENLTGYLPLPPGQKALSFLPLSHIFERTATYLYLLLGFSIWYAESVERIADNLREVQPQVFTTVPRLLEKIYDKIVAKGKELTGLKKKLFFWALDLGLKYDTQKNQGVLYNAQLALANKLVFSKWREAMGGQVHYIVSGGGALQPRLARVFWAAGIRVMEGYGMTETSPVIAASQPEASGNLIGAVGPAIPGVELKLASDGEILTRSPSVMQGYYNRPDLTAETIDADGWLHTGDIGELVQGRFLKITDRKKEMFKTSNGKYVAPQPLESRISESPLVEQVMVVGEGEKFASALLVPAFTELRAWAKSHNLPTDLSDAALAAHAQVQALYEQLVQQTNAAFAQWEQIKKVALLPTLWSVESGELTPTMKVKRKIIRQNNQQRIEALYR